MWCGLFQALPYTRLMEDDGKREIGKVCASVYMGAAVGW